MPLHCWCYLLGLICLAAGAGAALAPAPYTRFWRTFTRNKAAGIALSTIAWVWAGFALMTMGLDFLEPFKRWIPAVILVCIPLTWLWLDNLLPCRALAGILMLFPCELLHAARVHPSPWRLVVVSLAYICIVKGMILMLYPWKLRQALDWLDARPALLRLCGALNGALGLILILLGALILR